MSEKKHIDLHLPTGWNQCTTRELEIIAGAVLLNIQRQDRYHVFDMAKVKVDVFLAINELEVIESGASTGSEADEKTFLVRFRQPTKWERIKARIGRASYDFDINHETDAFELPVGYIHAMIEQNLAWIDDEKAEPMVRFPYPKLEVTRPTLLGHKTVAIAGPSPLIDGYSWVEYRYLQDWMQMYVMQSNALKRLTDNWCGRDQAYINKIAKAMADVDHARAEFLAVLFGNKELRAKNSWDDKKNGASLTRMFEGFDPVKWQVILFWWAGLMKVLARKFPHVFKVQPVKKGVKQQTPWDFYNRVTATLQKDGHLSEDDLNRETYSVTLQKLEMMAVEAEEMKKIKKKK